MLSFAIGAHVGTAIAAALIAYGSSAQAGYYVAGFFLITTAFRPAAAYLAHVRARIGTLARESTYPRDDVTALLHQVENVRELVTEQRTRVQQLSESLRLADSRLTDSIAHTRQLLSANIVQLQGSEAADREACRAGRDEVGRRVDGMVRRMEATLDGLSDQQELLPACAPWSGWCGRRPLRAPDGLQELEPVAVRVLAVEAAHVREVLVEGDRIARGGEPRGPVVDVLQSRPGWALRAGWKLASTPRCSSMPSPRNQQPPRRASTGGFSISASPSTPAKNSRWLSSCRPGRTAAHGGSPRLLLARGISTSRYHAH